MNEKQKISEQISQEYERLYKQEQTLRLAIEDLEAKLQSSPEYLKLVELKAELDNLYNDFKSRSVEVFETNGLKTVDGKCGKITMRESVTYRVQDEKAVPETFFKRAVDMAAIKKQYLLHKEVPGIERKISHTMILTPKRNGESS